MTPGAPDSVKRPEPSKPRENRRRLRGGGVGVVNLAQLASYTVYPGIAQVPSDAWPAEPITAMSD